MKERRRDRGMKQVYVVKSTEDKLRDFEPKKQTDTRNVYVLRTSEEVINKYSDIVYDFVDDGGLFVLIGTEKVFYQSFKRALVFELGLETEYIQVLHNPRIAMAKLGALVDSGLNPFVILTHKVDGQSTLPVLTEIKKTYPKSPVIMLSRELNRERLMQLYEEGASHILNQTSSVNEIIRKVVHILKPQTEIDELVSVGNKLNQDNRFDEAILVANTIFTKRPKSPRAHMILGDAYKGLAKRNKALKEYLEAEKNSSMFIDPLKKIFMIYAEDRNKQGMLDYLVKLDGMSPLNFSRKVKIGDLSYELGRKEEAESYYDNAIKAASGEVMGVAGEMSLDIAEKLMASDPERAAKYYKKSLAVISESMDMTSMNTFNRLGISLRKAGLWQEAVEAYTVAERISPGDENIQYNIGLAYLDGLQFHEAANHMRMALRMNSKLYMSNVDVAFNMAVAFEKSGNPSQADVILRFVFDQDPDHPGARALKAARPA